MGTTRTRVWFTEDGVVRAHQSGDFGVRNVASGQPRQWLVEELSLLLKKTQMDAASRGLNKKTTAILAAGMITSDHGLQAVDHVEAPVSEATLARRLWRGTFSGDFDLPLVMVPGVRTLGPDSGMEGVLQSDMLRGEETLCFGLLKTGLLQPSMGLFNLGSHWKWISIDEEARISASRTTLTGEMIHAIRSHTLIASALPQGPPGNLDSTWVDLGFHEARHAGLGRAMFGVRLLEQAKQGSSDDRLSFLYGAFIQSEIVPLLAQMKGSDRQVLISGHASLAKHWGHYLNLYGVPATIITEAEQEHAYLTGLLALSQKHL